MELNNKLLLGNNISKGITIIKNLKLFFEITLTFIQMCDTLK